MTLRRRSFELALAVLSTAGLLLSACGTTESPATAPAADVEQVDVTAYVVAYHWGFALFDEDGGELGQLRVPVGAGVELVAVNDQASEAIAQLPDAVAEAIRTDDWHERVYDDVEAGRIPDPQSRMGMTPSETLDVAFRQYGGDHSLMVTGVGAEVFLDAEAHEPERLVFTVDREGAFEFRCNVECGFGHDYQRWELLLVEA